MAFSLPFMDVVAVNFREVTTWCCMPFLRLGGSCKVRNDVLAADVVPVVEVIPTLFPEAAM